jgi:hypothetical protein
LATPEAEVLKRNLPGNFIGYSRTSAYPVNADGASEGADEFRDEGEDSFSDEYHPDGPGDPVGDRDFGDLDGDFPDDSTDYDYHDD